MRLTGHGRPRVLLSCTTVPAKASTSVFLRASTSCSIEVFPSAASLPQRVIPGADIRLSKTGPHRLGQRDGLAHGRLHELPRLSRGLERAVGRAQHGGRLVDPHVDHELVPEASDHVGRNDKGNSVRLEKVGDPQDPLAPRPVPCSRASPKWIFPRPENRVAFPSLTASIPRIIAKRDRSPRRRAKAPLRWRSR